MFAASARSAALSAGPGRRAASTIASKYSSAVFSAALKASPQTLNKVQTELNAIHAAVKATPELATFVNNPTLSTKDRAAGLPKLFTAAGKEPVSDVTKNLFLVLSENGRLVETEGVIEGFNELVAAHKGELTVTITSATALPRDVQTRLETLLKQSQAAQAAKTLKITNKINPSVLGGVIVDFGDKTIDLSVVSRVNKLNSLLSRTLASVLRRYPFGIGLLREILQNSDDAGATKQIFVLDAQHHPTDTLLRSALSHLQGPALLAFNDTVFKDKDWEGIRTVSQSSKKDEDEKIGKHGLGSRAYYHLTDNPQYLSGDALVVFDPHRWAFEEGGWRDTLSELAAHYPHQLEPFQLESFRNFGRMDDTFPGTVVRLALRSPSSNSRIGTKAPSVKDLRDLLQTFIREELHLALLFLSHLQSIEVHEIDSKGQFHVLATANKVTTSVAQNLSCASIQVSEGTRSSTSEWYIIRTTGPPHECEQLLAEALDDSPVYVAEELKREKLRPDVALAFNATTSSIEGRLFTFLPLPLRTSFPCHIHGIFSLTDSRQNLRNPSETILAGTADELAVAWNRLLFNTFVPRAWLAFLEAAVSRELPLDLYSFMPPLQDTHTSGDAAYWSGQLDSVLRLALEKRAAIWSEVSGSPSRSPRNISLDNALIASPQDGDVEVRTLAAAGVSLIKPPANVYTALKSRLEYRLLSPNTARNALLTCRNGLQALDQSERDVIINFLLQSNDLTQLVDIPIIPLVSGRFTDLRGRSRGSPIHVLFDAQDEEIFGQFDSDAIALDRLPPKAKKLLIENGARLVNVNKLNKAQTLQYVRAAQKQSGTWAWSTTRDWFALFWTWIADCSFSGELVTGIKTIPTLPTTSGRLRCTGDVDVFVNSIDLSQSRRNVLSSCGITFLDPAVSSPFLLGHCPKLVKYASSPGDLLDAWHAAPLQNVPGDIADALRSHLAEILRRSSVRLSQPQKTALRNLPIHPILTSSNHTVMSPLSASRALYCITRPAGLPFPLPHLPDGIFVHASTDEQRLLEEIDYQSATHPLSERQVFDLAVEHMEQQTPEVHRDVLRYVSDHRRPLLNTVESRLKAASIVRVGINGALTLPPQEIVDPSSALNSNYPPLNRDAEPFLGAPVNVRITELLSSLRLLKRDVDADFISDRIQQIASLPSDSTVAHYAARSLLASLDKSRYDCTDVKYDHQAAWIPTSQGLKRPSESRDTSKATLYNSVLHILDLHLHSESLRTLLGWNQPVPLEVIMQQFRHIVSTTTEERYYFDLVCEFGRRYMGLSSVQLDALRQEAQDKAWVLIEGGKMVVPPAHAHFDDIVRLPGFARVSMEIVNRDGVRQFLQTMGCSNRPTNSTISAAIRRLEPEANQNAVSHCIALLAALDFSAVDQSMRESLRAPGNDGRLHPLSLLTYNDRRSGAHLYQFPEECILVHQEVPRKLCQDLQIPSLTSLNLGQALDLGFEDMRMEEDITTRISNVLRSYTIEQAFGEFLANAADAGARQFDVMLDDDSRRRAAPSALVCEDLAPYFASHALVVHNDALFTENDIRGICRIGRGGKDDDSASIGRFGLGALSFYHFSELAMILSGKYLVLLEPGGQTIPEDDQGRSRNALIVGINNIRGLFPGHLQVFEGLFGYCAGDDFYDGTLIRLPLRTGDQARKSSLSKHAVSSIEVVSLMQAYRSTAAQSLFFIDVDKVSAYDRGSDRPSAQLWSIKAHRKRTNQYPAQYDLRHVDLTETLRSSGFSYPVPVPHTSTSKWRVVERNIDPNALPDWIPSIVAKYRLKRLSVALAARIAPADSPNSDAHSFFSSLPLPVPTALPVHIHASFVLADDRRNIRWDGDGSMNEESKFNRWLLTSQLPDLYIYLLEVFAQGDPTVHSPWPFIRREGHDPLSLAITESIYRDDCLGSTTRKIFRSVTGKTLGPSQIFVRGPSQPTVVNAVLESLRPDDLVGLPALVLSKVRTLNAIKKTDTRYVCSLARRKSDIFLEHCSLESDVVKTVNELLTYFLEPTRNNDSAGPLTVQELIGLPLLPLADGSLGVLRPSTHVDGVVYASSWGVHTPWPLFPAKSFVAPGLKYDNLVGDPKSNVKAFDGAAVVSLLKKSPHIADSAIQTVSEAAQRWILDFWATYDSGWFPGPELEHIAQFALIPTAKERVFVSLQRARSLPTIGQPPTYTLYARLLQQRAASEAQWMAERLVALGANVIHEPEDRNHKAILPHKLRTELKDVAFSFKRVVDVLNHIGLSALRSRLASWPDDDLNRFSAWLQTALETSVVGVGGGPSTSILASLPMWKVYRADRWERCPPKALTDSSVGVLPMITGVTADRLQEVVTFLGKSRFPFFVHLNAFTISVFKPHVIPMSISEFCSSLKFPDNLDNASFSIYSYILNIILATPDSGNSGVALLAPCKTLRMVQISSLYQHDIPEFLAAFNHRPHYFLHAKLHSKEPQLVSRFGLQKEKSLDTFEECLKAIDEDFDNSDTADRNRSMVVYRWYCNQVPLLASSQGSNWWRRLDRYAFVPRRGDQRRVGGSTTFRVEDFATPLPLLVRPTQVVRDEYASVAWTQRALFPTSVDTGRLFLADQSLGVPTSSEVVEHLRVLALSVSPSFPRGNKDLLADLKATYAFLATLTGLADLLHPHRDEPLFLNVADPERDPWVFVPATLLTLNVPDDGDYREARAFLQPFRALLVAAGAYEIRRVTAPALAPPTPADDALSLLRAGFDGLRTQRILTDVVFRAPDGEGGEVWAHRALLASASEHFYDQFASGFTEGGPASAQDPIVVLVENAQELQCTRLIIEYIYTGHLGKSEGMSTQLALMHLAHRRQVPQVQVHAEVLLVEHIQPGTYLQLRQDATAVEGKTLLGKIDEFEQTNAVALGQMASFAFPT
ncbi:uncharacterized protein BXZ73DRAFT_43603 [Epithele typhae]|uniref:uncharacterized protein n=1 Tax=Epithele typhae TaxID=378194 RepID=UPI0020078BDB|nr:uncharacterized protein BXZ73DRAFT_43603 [Epithele typhae]KAH9939666.1 hypothetical protein BXZ73DRAFT_43603 [Epithele typhae]